jgi:hypothetical protein
MKNKLIIVFLFLVQLAYSQSTAKQGFQKIGLTGTMSNYNSVLESENKFSTGALTLGSNIAPLTNTKLKVTGNIELDNSTATTGNIYKNGDLFLHNPINGLFIGVDVGNLSITGGQNVGLGRNILLPLTSGHNNVGIGEDDFTSVTTANSNVAIGNSLLEDLTTGYNNIALGVGILSSITTHFGNIAIGNSGLSSIKGNNNVSIGDQASQDILTGNNNVFLGFNSGNIGAQLLNISNSIAIGANTYTQNSNEVVIGDNNIVETKLKGKITLNNILVQKGYTVSTLPTGVVGASCYVTDLLAPTYMATAVGGGVVTWRVFYDGTSWKVD